MASNKENENQDSKRRKLESPPARDSENHTIGEANICSEADDHGIIEIYTEWLVEIYDKYNKELIQGETREYPYMNAKRGSRLSLSSKLVAVAAILDPRYKLALVEFLYYKLYGNSIASLHLKMIHSFVNIYYNIYVRDLYRGTIPMQDDDSLASLNGDIEEDTVESFQRWYDSKRNKVPTDWKSELDKYLEEQVIAYQVDDEFKVLDWWEEHASKYPILGRMACDYLTLPFEVIIYGSSAANEKAMMDNPILKGLDPITLEAIICANDWLEMESPQQSKQYIRPDKISVKALQPLLMIPPQDVNLQDARNYYIDDTVENRFFILLKRRYDKFAHMYVKHHSFDSSMAFFLPMCLNEHWLLFCADIDKKKLLWLDSSRHSQMSHASEKNAISDWFLDFLLPSLGYHQPNEWSHEIPKDIPMQKNLPEAELLHCFFHLSWIMDAMASNKKIENQESLPAISGSKRIKLISPPESDHSENLTVGDQADISSKPDDGIVKIKTEWLVEFYDIYKKLSQGETKDYFYMNTRGNKWNLDSRLVAVAAILDPRYKLALVEFLYSQLYGNSTASIHLTNIRNILNVFFACYVRELDRGTCMQDDSLASLNGDIEEDTVESFQRWYDSERKVPTEAFFWKSDLDKYLEEPIISSEFGDQFQVLDWWREHASEYPILGRMARDYLTMPFSAILNNGSSAVHEKAMMDNPILRGLDPLTIEAMICTKDWLEFPQEIDYCNHFSSEFDHNEAVPSPGKEDLKSKAIAWSEKEKENQESSSSKKLKSPPATDSENHSIGEAAKISSKPDDGIIKIKSEWLVEFYDIYKKLSEGETRDYPYMNMWGNKLNLGSQLVAVAAILDPRYKLALVVFLYNKLYGNSTASVHLTNIRNVLNKLFNSYVRELYRGTSMQDDPYNSLASLNGDIEEDTMESFQRWYDSKRKVPTETFFWKSELDKYLEEPIISYEGDDEFKVLDWWREHASEYPLLGRMACDYLTMPFSVILNGSSAANEKAMMDNPILKGLDPLTMEAMICTKDWLEMESPQQSYFQPNDWSHEIPTNIPMQKNSVDCALFLMKYADCLTHGDHFPFTEDDMPHFRLSTLLDLSCGSVP
ncbi:Peptidase C48, SUMO/Sentrin/Ubl1 [Corchorus olitorius]|uniref:Peptidase C48, SUMO/Sentrin/Ubl1 n=1 Tax=Corchorus olitorius TaxID=93759 RepID=A0A1R3HV75_9ROSI|nr:Peptidase C48, SUMO/Sentrin/Ubl1 [Corchorus olitorius]